MPKLNTQLQGHPKSRRNDGTADGTEKKLSALRQDKAGGADNLLPRLLNADSERD